MMAAGQGGFPAPRASAGMRPSPFTRSRKPGGRKLGDTGWQRRGKQSKVSRPRGHLRVCVPGKPAKQVRTDPRPRCALASVSVQHLRSLGYNDPIEHGLRFRKRFFLHVPCEASARTGPTRARTVPSHPSVCPGAWTVPGTHRAPDNYRSDEQPQGTRRQAGSPVLLKGQQDLASGWNLLTGVGTRVKVTLGVRAP